MPVSLLWNGRKRCHRVMRSDWWAFVRSEGQVIRHNMAWTLSGLAYLVPNRPAVLFRVPTLDGPGLTRRNVQVVV